MSGQGLALKLALGLLARRHNVYPEPFALPLAPASATPLVLQGHATTLDIDRERMRWRAYAFGYPLPKSCIGVPLLFRHREPAGHIVHLSYDEVGALTIRAHVDHPLALRCGAFSIAATVLDYTLHDADGPAFFAEINQATLDEVSLTPTPANSNARVTSRAPVPRVVETHELMARKTANLGKLLERMIQQQART